MPKISIPNKPNCIKMQTFQGLCINKQNPNNQNMKK